MLQQDYLKKMVNMNKLVFDNSYNVMTMFQDQAERMTNLLLDQNPLGSEQSKKMINDWCETCKKGQDSIKKTVDQGFQTIEGYFV